MKHEALIIPRNSRLDNLIEKFIRNWERDPTGLDRVLKNNGKEVIKSNKNVHTASST